MKRLASMITGSLMLLATPAFADDSCFAPGTWKANPAFSGNTLTSVIEAAATRPVVLLGETHDNAEHHRWQLQMIAALHAHNENMVLGFEMFPRRVQDALDQWTRGDIDQETFLKKSDWAEAWGHHQDLYMPLFHFARMNRIPMVALNVEMSLIRAVGAEGWENVPEDQKEGLQRPAPAPQSYKDFLAEIFSFKSHMESGSPHGSASGGSSSGEDKSKPDLSDDPAFNNFVEAQLTWDGAMAQKIAEVHQAGGEPLVIGVMGSGHLRGKDGVPYQLTALGIEDSAVLLPWDADGSCEDWSPGLADAVFSLALPDTIDPAPPAKPRLGVRIRTGDTGVLIDDVLDGTVAASAGIQQGDIIIEAAGFSVATTSELVEVIQRQAPGTWLPLKVLREAETTEIIARFPQAF